jgi:flagellar biosynthesis/type III secretory pathway protein FliH
MSTTNPTMRRLLPFIEQAAAALESDRLYAQELAEAAREAMASQTAEDAYQAGRQQGWQEERTRILSVLDFAWESAPSLDALRRAIEASA